MCELRKGYRGAWRAKPISEAWIRSRVYRVGDLKKWARNRPRAATGTTDLD
ncbi:hypothetical protein [Streptomyces sp. NPDC017988]|uniref:hypothetical protein n=1 Tax=Streptomyces sp. NPDC017988 TaxID=3365025 RepID=UPI0037B570EC